MAPKKQGRNVLVGLGVFFALFLLKFRASIFQSSFQSSFLKPDNLVAACNPADFGSVREANNYLFASVYLNKAKGFEKEPKFSTVASQQRVSYSRRFIKLNNVQAAKTTSQKENSLKIVSANHYQYAALYAFLFGVVLSSKSQLTKLGVSRTTSRISPSTSRQARSRTSSVPQAVQLNDPKYREPSRLGIRKVREEEIRVGLVIADIYLRLLRLPPQLSPERIREIKREMAGLTFEQRVMRAVDLLAAKASLFDGTLQTVGVSYIGKTIQSFGSRLAKENSAEDEQNKLITVARDLLIKRLREYLGYEQVGNFNAVEWNHELLSCWELSFVLFEIINPVTTRNNNEVLGIETTCINELAIKGTVYGIFPHEWIAYRNDYPGHALYPAYQTRGNLPQWSVNLFRSLYNTNHQSFANGLRRLRKPYFDFLCDQEVIPQTFELTQSFHFSQLPVTNTQVTNLEQFFNSGQTGSRPIFLPDDFANNVVTDFTTTAFFEGQNFRGGSLTMSVRLFNTSMI